MSDDGLKMPRRGDTRKKIFYIDDVNYSLVSLKNRLHEQYEVYPAESYSKLHELLEKVTPDLMLMDINMPDIDGYEALKRLKADDRYSAIPVIFLTSKSDRESVVKGLSLGAADYIIKPYNVTKLIESIENNLKSETLDNNPHEDGTRDKPSVLVVDDVSSMLRSMQYALRSNYKVYILSKSEDVVDFLQTKKPDLILLDYLMPVINGFGLIPLIREIPGHSETPIIIITTEGTKYHVNNAVSLGASDFIAKPFDPKELNDKVKKHIRIAKELQRIKEETQKLYE